MSSVSVLDAGSEVAIHPHRWVALVVLCAAALIINLDNTILNVALPTLVRALQVLQRTPVDCRCLCDGVRWVAPRRRQSGRSIRAQAFLPCRTRDLRRRIGRRRIFGPVPVLIAFRAVMGIGAALTIPSSLSIVNDVFRDPQERARAIGIWGGTIGLGIAIGPIAGGLLLSFFWWGSIFLVNIPIVIVAFAGALIIVPTSKNPHADRPDPVGAVLSIIGLGLLLWAIIEAPDHGWSSAGVIGVGEASLAVLGSFVIWEARSHHPMLKLELFSDRRFSIALLAEVLGTFGLLGALFLQTQFLQFDLGNWPLRPGYEFSPWPPCSSPAPPFLRLFPALSGSSSPSPSGSVPPPEACGSYPRLVDRNDVWRCPIWSGADRFRGRPSHPDGDQFGGGIGSPGRLRSRISNQRRGSAGWWSAWRCRHRQRDVDPLSGPHGHCPCRATCAPLDLANHLGFTRRCTRRCREARWNTRRTPVRCGSGGIHEWRPRVIAGRSPRSPVWRPDRPCISAFSRLSGRQGHAGGGSRGRQ